MIPFLNLVSLLWFYANLRITDFVASTGDVKTKEL